MLAKSVAVFFSITTVVVFAMSRSGILLNYVSPSVAWFAVVANFVLLAISLIVFILQRAQRDMPAKQALDTLESYATRAGANVGKDAGQSSRNGNIEQ